MDNSLQSAKNYKLLKYQQNCILLQHKVTKAVYQYHQLSQEQNHPNIEYQNIVCPQLCMNGIIYPVCYSNLQKELLKKNKSKKEYFRRQQIAETFIPVIRSMQYLHKQNIVHGFLHLVAIVIDYNAEIKLLLTKTQRQQNQYYWFNNSQIKTFHDDRKALGFIIIQLSLLITIQELKQKTVGQFFKQIEVIFGSNFSKGLQILMDQSQPNYQSIIQLFQKEHHTIINIQKPKEKLNDLRQEINQLQKNKTKHKIFLNNSENQHLTNKFKIRTPNIKHRQEHSENKKKFEQIKQKASRTLSKIPDFGVKNLQNHKLLKKRNVKPDPFKLQDCIQLYSKTDLRPSIIRGLPTHCFNIKI